MVLPIGFALSRIPASGGGDHWVAYTTTDAFNAVGVRSMQDRGAILLNIENNTSNKVYSLDALAPSTENWGKLITSIAGPGGVRWATGSFNSAAGFNASHNVGAQMDITYSATNSLILVNGAYMFQNYGDYHPAQIYLNANDGSTSNEYMQYKSGREQYSNSWCAMIMGDDGEVSGAGWLQDSSDTYPYRDLACSHKARASVDLHSASFNDSFIRFKKASVLTRLSPNGKYGFFGYCQSDSQYADTAYLTRYWWLNNGSGAASNIFVSTYNNRFYDGFCSCSTNTGVTYTGFAGLPNNSTSRSSIMIQKFANGMGYTGTADLGLGIAIRDGSWTNDIRLIDICVDSTDTYLYALVAHKSANSLDVFRINTSTMTLDTSLQITNTNITNTYGTNNKKHGNFDLYDDDSLLITHFDSGKILLTRIPSDLSVSGTYGSVTFGSSSLSTNGGKTSYSTSYDPYISSITSVGSNRSTTSGVGSQYTTSSTSYNANLTQANSSSFALSFTEDSI